MRLTPNRRLSVEYHPDSKHLFEQFDTDFPGLTDNIKEDFADFIRYLRGDGESIPRRYGRHGPYSWPKSIASLNLMHVHICVPPRHGFVGNFLDQRACRDNEPERDAALVYTEHMYDEGRFCLLALLYPEAHSQARNEQVMRHLADLARRFHDS
jgi:mRNA interferase YafO